MNAIERAALSASVSWRTQLPPDVLVDMLRVGVVDEAYRPHLHSLVDDLSTTQLDNVVEHMQVVHGIAPDHTWAVLRAWANEVKSRRAIWR